MNWIWLAGAGLVGLIVGATIRGRLRQRLAAEEELYELRRSSAIDRKLALSTLRRELANFMVRLDPDRFLRLYREARATDIAISESDKPTQSVQFAAICEQFPYFHDFDLVGTREHVLYGDELSSQKLEDIEAHYLNMIKFHALQCALNEEWRNVFSATSDSDLEHLESYVRQIKDTKFKQRLKSAITEFYSRRGDRDSEGEISYETDMLAVYHVYHVAEIRLGFHFKDTNEYGLYGSFYDDERHRKYESFYRSDKDFEAEKSLDDLSMDDPI